MREFPSSERRNDWVGGTGRTDLEVVVAWSYDLLAIETIVGPGRSRKIPIPFISRDDAARCQSEGVIDARILLRSIDSIENKEIVDWSRVSGMENIDTKFGIERVVE